MSSIPKSEALRSRPGHGPRSDEGPSGPQSGVQGPSGPQSGVQGPSGPPSGVQGPSGPQSGIPESATGALPRHYLKPCLLLLLAEGPSHGYELLEQVRGLGIQAAEPGGLYRYLRSMEKEELVNSWWEPSQAGPARRTYILSDAGRSALRASVDSLRDVRQLLVGLLDRYDSVAGAVEAPSRP